MWTRYRPGLLLAGLWPIIAGAAVPPIPQAELDRSPQVSGKVTAIRWQSVPYPGNPACAAERTATITLQQETGSVEIEGRTIVLSCNNGWVGDTGVSGLSTLQVGDRVRIWTVGPEGGPLGIRKPNGLQRLDP